MEAEAQSQAQDRDRETTTGRFSLVLFVVVEVLCTGVLVAVGDSLDLGPSDKNGHSMRDVRGYRIVRLTPLRRFVRTETGGAAVLVAAVLAALVWANVGLLVRQE